MPQCRASGQTIASCLLSMAWQRLLVQISTPPVVSDVEHDQNETFIHMKYTIHPHRSSISLQKNGLLCFLTLPARESSSERKLIAQSAFSNSKLAFHVRQANAPRPSQDVGSPDLQSCFRILQVSFQLCVLISQRDQLYVGSCCSAHLQIQRQILKMILLP